MKMNMMRFLVVCLLLLFCMEQQLKAQTSPYTLIENPCNGTGVANVSIIAVGDFPNATDNGDGTYTKCVDLLADEGIDPTTISSDITASLFYDNGFSSADFTTSNGFSTTGATNPQVGGVGNHFSYATLPNDNSGVICVIVDVAASQLNEIGFFLTIEHGTTTGVGITATGFIDNELVYTDNNARECEVGTLPIAMNGTAADVGTINLSFSMSEVELNDARTIDVRFEACGVIYDETIDPEPDLDAIGVAILNITLDDVPGDCTELAYAFCADAGQQSYGVGGIAMYQSCFMDYEVRLDKIVDTTQASIGDTISFTITVFNEEDAVTGATVTELLPPGLTYYGSYTASTGTFDGTTWTIGNMGTGVSDTINIWVQVATDGVINNKAILIINETETDTTNNESQACLSIPIDLCDDGSQSIDATAFDVNGDGSTMYRWYVSTDNGATYDSIPANNGGTAQTYNITQAAYYTYVVNDGDLGNCGDQLCCPIIVETMTCTVCPPKNCIPIQIEQTN